MPGRLGHAQPTADTAAGSVGGISDLTRRLYKELAMPGRKLLRAPHPLDGAPDIDEVVK